MRRSSKDTEGEPPGRWRSPECGRGEVHGKREAAAQRGEGDGAAVLDGATCTGLSDKNRVGVPARWLGWLKHHPVHQRVVGSIPCWGVYGRH